jgi:ATP-binding cassette subfamily B protein
MAEHTYHGTYAKERTGFKSLDYDLLKRLFAYLLPTKSGLGVAIFFLVGARLIDAFLPIYLGFITQKFIHAFDLSLEQRKEVFYAIVDDSIILMFVLVCGYIFDSISVLVKCRIGKKAVFLLRNQVFDHIQHMPLAYFDKQAIGRLMTRTVHDVDQIDQMFTDSIVPIFGGLILFCTMGLAIVWIEWRVALAIAFVFPLLYFLTNYFRKNQRRCYENARAIASAMNSFIQEHLMGAMTIRNFGLEEQEKKRFEEINDDEMHAYLESVDYFGFLVSGIDFLQSLTLVIIFITLYLFSPPGQGFQAGTFFAFSLYTLMFFRPLIDLSERYNILQSAMAASARIFEVLDNPAENLGSGLPNKIVQVDSIEFDNVWFAYQEENWILKGMSFRLNRGDSLALVGVTGAGKSSIASLLLRFYDFQKGSIRLNGRDIRAYSIQEVRRHFSLVLQDPVIFSGTIADNIALYDQEVTRDAIKAASDYVGLSVLVNKFSDGLDHLLIERGKSLSVGEMQLMALARAVAHDRSVFILDEATANIDSGTEKIIQEALEKILQNKTALVIAHRLSTIKDVKRILVIHDGVVVESGTHQELLNARGIYEKLYRLQYTVDL